MYLLVESESVLMHGIVSIPPLERDPKGWLFLSRYIKNNMKFEAAFDAFTNYFCYVKLL